MHPSEAMGFEWDDDNEEHLARHGVMPWEAEEVAINGPIWMRNQAGRSADWKAVGVTNGGAPSRYSSVLTRRRQPYGSSPAGPPVEEISAATYDRTGGRMDERKGRGEYYEAHSDDDNLWGAPENAPPTGAPGRRSLKGLTETITVRFSAEEADLIRRLARADRLTYSEVIRRAVMALRHAPTAREETVVHMYVGDESDQGSEGREVAVRMESEEQSTYTEAPHIHLQKVG